MGSKKRNSTFIKDASVFLVPARSLVSSEDQFHLIQEKINRANCRRGGIYGSVIFFMELMLVFFLDLPRIADASHDIVLFRTYFYLHVVLAVLSFLFSVISYLLLKRKKRVCLSFEKVVPLVFLALILLVLSEVALLDLQSNGQLVVYTSSMLIASLLCLIRFPWNGLVFGVPFLAFLSGLLNLSLSPSVLLSSLVNGSVIFVASILISTFMYRDYFLHRLKNLMLEDANRKLSHLATHDPLTGMGNRRFFEERIERELHLVSRYQQNGSLLLLDVDHFKTINDTYGHDVGDKVLKMIAQYIRKEIRDIDLSARWGGEEFVVFLPSVGKDAGVSVAERLRIRFEENPIVMDNLVIPVTVSIGYVSLSREKDLLFDEVFKIADGALYEAKNSGRNRVVSRFL